MWSTKWAKWVIDFFSPSLPQNIIEWDEMLIKTEALMRWHLHCLAPAERCIQLMLFLTTHSSSALTSNESFFDCCDGIPFFGMPRLRNASRARYFFEPFPRREHSLSGPGQVLLMSWNSPNWSLEKIIKSIWERQREKLLIGSVGCLAFSLKSH